MANLTETQVAFRRIILIIFIMAIGFYTLRFGINQSVKLYRYLFPAQIPAPEAKFGKLPQLRMSSIKISGAPMYNLDTKSGGLPEFPDRLKVYAVPVPKSSLLAEQGIKDLANDLKFDDNFTKRNTTEFRWGDGINSRTYNADVVTKNFQLNTTAEKLTSVLGNALTITTDDSVEMVGNFIRSKSLMQSDDLASIRFETIPAIVSLGKLRESKIDRERSKLMKVDVYRDLIAVKGAEKTGDGEVRYKILGPNPKNSLINFYTSNSNEPFKYPIINFTYWPADYGNGSEYSLSPIGSVWQAIVQGSGIITYLRRDNDDYFDSFIQNMPISRVDIKEIYLAYYENREFQDYLQPIYVFEGTFTAVSTGNSLPQKGDIIIYYPAVRGDFVSQ